jgi:hypothetical protein
MESTEKQCFVCNKSYPAGETSINNEVMLPVCTQCKGTEKEKKTVEEYLDSLADGLVCGCI